MSIGLFSRRDLQRKRRKSLRKRKFDYSKFINDYYIDDDGSAYISASVDGIQDIVSEYSIKGYDWINPDFMAYVEESFYYIPIEDHVVLEICGVPFTEEEQQRIRKLITNYCHLKLGDVQLDLNTNTKRIVFLILVGLLTLLLYVWLSKWSAVELAVELVPILFWCFLENGIDMIIYERSDIQERKQDAEQLANMSIIFNENEK